MNQECVSPWLIINLGNTLSIQGVYWQEKAPSRKSSLKGDFHHGNIVNRSTWNTLGNILKGIIPNNVFLADFLSLILVGVLWGATNPLIKIGAKGVEKVGKKSKQSIFGLLLSEFRFLVFNWKYVLPFLANQSGSVLYYFTLQHTDLSLAVPITNSVAFLSTALMGWLMGEEVPNKRTILGMLFIISGILCYIRDNV